jgi:3-phenylpropionate/trans-cinnamate dioxygenase ferredoxin reductase subunit
VIAFWLDDANRVLAGMNINVWDVNEAVQALIRSRTPVDPARLADPDVPLERLAGAPAEP